MSVVHHSSCGPNLQIWGSQARNCIHVIMFQIFMIKFFIYENCLNVIRTIFYVMKGFNCTLVCAKWLSTECVVANTQLEYSSCLKVLPELPCPQHRVKQIGLFYRVIVSCLCYYMGELLGGWQWITKPQTHSLATRRAPNSMASESSAIYPHATCELGHLLSTVNQPLGGM